MSIQGVPPQPDLKKADNSTVAIAKYLRQNETIKQRPALLGGQRWDMFKVKRAVRALLDPAYIEARAQDRFLPEIPDRRTALEILATFPPQGFAVNVEKLETEDALAKGFRPLSGIPVVLIRPNQKVGDEEYMIWTYNPIPLTTYLYGGGVLVAGVAIALFQLWPSWARTIIYYLSIVCMGLVGGIIVIGVLRLILFVITAVSRPKGLWIFPNLFADVGVLQSFQPLWAWSGDKTLPEKAKPKKRKPKAKTTTTSNIPPELLAKLQQNGSTGSVAGSGPVAGTAPAGAVPPNGIPVGKVPMLMRNTPNGPVPVGPVPGIMPGMPPQMANPLMQAVLAVAKKRSDERLKVVMQTEPPRDQNELRAKTQAIMNEEINRAMEEFKQHSALMKAQQQGQQTPPQQQ